MRVKRHLSFIWLVLLLALIGVGGSVLRSPQLNATAAEQETPTEQALITQLRQETSGMARVSYHSRTGRVRFIGTESNRPIPRPPGVVPAAGSEEAARAFLGIYGKLFGLSGEPRELAVLSIKAAQPRRPFVRFQQMHNDVPVLGGELIVQVDELRNVVSASGEILPDPKANTFPVLDAQTARQRALDMVANNYSLRADALTTTEPELWLYNPLLLGAPGPQLTRLVWRVDVQSVELIPVRELVLVDAHMGFIALHFNQAADARYRKVYDNQNRRSDSLPGTGPVREEGQGATGITDVDRAYDYTGDTYDFYLAYHGRDSIDGVGMQLISTVRFCRSSTDYSCPYGNAFWNGQQMVFGQGFAAADDVVGHELTHGVTNHESRLFYYMQSGAINEALSDIWGEFVDQANGKGNDSPDVRWLHGEDLPGGASRNMKDPPNPPNACAYLLAPNCNDRQPDKMTSSYYFCGEVDNGGVHFNSGVADKAAYLLTDGGSFNGRLVSGLGMSKVAKIFYEVQANLLTSSSDYQDLYDALPQACTNLIGTSGITLADCQQVKSAVDATEMNLQPNSCQAPHAPICSSGQFSNNLFFDDLENPGSGKWKSAAITGTNEWYYPQNSHPYTGLDATYATSGSYNIWGNDRYGLADYFIQMTSDVPIPAGLTAYLHFNHAFAFDDFGTKLYDGGIVEYSTNSGGSWQDADPLFTHNGYNGTISSSWANPLGGRRAFVSESNGYNSSRLNLGSLAGQSVRFRFRIGTSNTSDSQRYGAGWGWFIDDVRIYTCQTQCITGTPEGPLDAPVNNSTVSGMVPVQGWSAVVSGATAGMACRIELFVDGILAGPLTAGAQRADVKQFYAGRGIAAPDSLGFSGSWNSQTVANGSHRLAVRVADAAASSREAVVEIASITVTTNNPTTTPTIPPVFGTPLGALDNPAANAVVRGDVVLGGWATVISGNIGAAASRIELLVDGRLVCPMTAGIARPDVQQYFAGQGITASGNLGFSGSWNSRSMANGSHRLAIRAADAAGASRELAAEIVSLTVTVDNPSGPTTSTTTTLPSILGTPVGALDAPAANAVVQGDVVLGGWAVIIAGNTAAAASRIELLVDGTLVGPMTAGIARPDVQQHLAGQGIGAPGNLGFSGSWNSRSVANGTHRLAIRAADAAGASGEAVAEIGAVTVTVNNPAVTTTSSTVATTTLAAPTTTVGMPTTTSTLPSIIGTPMGALDVPAANAFVQGGVVLGGWVAVISGNTAAVASRIVLLVDGTLVGPMTAGIARPDVQQYLAGQGIGAPDNLGFSGSWDSRSVANGTHQLAIRAADAAGASREVVVEIAASTVTVNNPPPSSTTTTTGITTTTTLVPGPLRVSLDVPADNATVSGDVSLGGWAAVVAGNTAVLAGRIELLVDGMLVGPMAMGIARPDVQQFFAGQGISAPGNLGYAGSWNSTSVSNGAHQLIIRATDLASVSQETTVEVRRNVTVDNSGPRAGFWASGTGDEFYVSPDSKSVLRFAIYVNIPQCGGVLKITRTADVPIIDSQFSFTGSYYGNGVFDSAIRAHGRDGLSQFNIYIPGVCSGYVSGGPWSYTADWRNSSQPSSFVESGKPGRLQSADPVIMGEYLIERVHSESTTVQGPGSGKGNSFAKEATGALRGP